VKKRLETYHSQTKPVVQFYKNAGVRVSDIQADGGPADVNLEVEKLLSGVNNSHKI